MKHGQHHSEEANRRNSEAHKGKHPSDQTWKKLSKVHKGKPFSEEHKRKIGKALIGIHRSEETRRKMSEIKRGKKRQPFSEEHRRKMSEAQSHRSLGTRQKMSEAKKGSKSHFWKGGITPLGLLVRKSMQYQEWHQKCFLRDDFTCQKCRERGGKLNVHHIKPFSLLLKEARESLPLFPPFEAVMSYSPLWDIENGLTLCKKCHNKMKKREYAVHISGGYKK